MTVLWCPDAHALKIGPGNDPSEWVIFHDGFAEVALDDELRDAKLAWIAHARLSGYVIDDLGEPGDDAADGRGDVCSPAPIGTSRRPCAVCGAKFTPERTTRRYCSPRCRKLAFQERVVGVP